MPIRIKEPHGQDPRKLASGRWQARVTYYATDTGKRKETSQTFATERAAKKWSREQEVQLRQGTVTPEALTSLTVNALLDRWLDAKRMKPVRESTLESYSAHVRHVRTAWGDRLIKDVRPADVQDLYAQVLETHEPRTAQYVATLVRASFDLAVNMELLVVNLSRKVPKPQVPRREIPVLTPEEAKHLLRVAMAHRLHALWWFLALTGVRKGEALGLQWTDIHWETKTVTIRRALSGAGRRREETVTKTKHSIRTIAIPDVLIQTLEQWRHEQRLQRVAATTWHDTPYVFTTTHGTPWDPANVLRQFKSLLRQSEMSLAWHPHDLRHAMATHWLAEAGHRNHHVSTPEKNRRPTGIPAGSSPGRAHHL